ncbi:hypothetical protein GGH96_002642 [Coemansia sp. RSA 1972]|nr:hypothetical protein GGH96_002642 [Coemansia sp. RSA 1972]
MNNARDDDKHLLAVAPALPAPVGQPQPQCAWCGRAKKAVKAVLALVAVALVVTMCAYAGSKTLFEIVPGWLGREGSTPNNIPGDCRSSGCRNGFTCSAVDAQVACFVGPCPSKFYECIPTAMVGKPDATEASILPISAENSPVMAQPSPDAEPDVPNGKSQRITEAFYSCVQQHDGQTTWMHPVDGCNTCRCTLRGTVACTKMLCSPGIHAADAVSQAVNQAGDVHTTVMVALASASGDTESIFYTSVPIDIEA